MFNTNIYRRKQDIEDSENGKTRVKSQETNERYWKFGKTQEERFLTWRQSCC